MRLVDIFDRGDTVIAEGYCGANWRLQQVIRRKRSELLRHGVITFDANVRPHTTNRTREW